ncbi:T9SS type A sorting domain-containing protein, partial [Candidatus Latescibacterota bacterium]
TAEASVTVTLNPVVVITPPEANVTVGDIVQFTAKVYDEFGEEVVDAPVEWAATENIGEITPEGLFTAITETEVPIVGTVTATADTLSAEAVVNVIDKRVFSFEVKERDTFIIFGIPYPLDFLDGMKLFFPEGSLSEDIIIITFTLPSFAVVDDDIEEVSFSGDIITAVSFEVSVNGEIVSPYTFGVPIEVSLPFDLDRLDELGLKPLDLTMIFVTSSGEFDSEGITDVVVDMDSNIITGKVAHFSDLAVAPKTVVAAVDVSTLPIGFTLGQNFPNPFNPVTTISYGLPVTSHVTITIYSILGQHVKTLVEEEKSPGNYFINWDGTDEAGKTATSGIYIYQIQAGNFKQSRKLMLVK